ncbi:cytidine and deoxycytidylate deaminase zinc-binding region-domain-containing protein [Baffinella frigidus]|nr:cytidine and deoxycytidylate deaminase zinc-binding region-domain-containing protein [Cryptophyta sp. CCMP2293]
MGTGQAPLLTTQMVMDWSECAAAVAGGDGAGEATPEAAVLLALLPRAEAAARPDISGFRVGAAGRGASGKVYLGCNIETAGVDLSHVIHAEAFVVASALAAGETHLTGLAVTSPPCGQCRQLLKELHRSENLEILVAKSGAKSISLEELLPHGFGPKDMDQSSALGVPVDNTLSFLEGQHADDHLAALALESANRAYAPYSCCPSGVALLLASGEVAVGSYSESCAFNPSISPMQAGLVSVVSAGGSPADITKCVLVQLPDARVSQEAATRAVLKAVAPAASFDLVRAVRRS